MFGEKYTPKTRLKFNPKPVDILQTIMELRHNFLMVMGYEPDLCFIPYSNRKELYEQLESKNKVHCHHYQHNTNCEPRLLYYGIELVFDASIENMVMYSRQYLPGQINNGEIIWNSQINVLPL
jgi:hypothetical protein